MARRSWLTNGPATAAALLAAAGLGIWSADRAADALGLGGPAAAAAPSPGPRPPARTFGRSSPVTVSGPALTFGAGSVQSKGGATPAAAGDGSPDWLEQDEAPAGEAERLAAAAAADGLRRLVRDLEYNREFPEPPQQVVLAAPAPWRPPAAQEATPAPAIEAIEPRSGPIAGGPVTIRGRSLRPRQVMFGSAPAQIVSASPAAVTVVAPRGAPGAVAIAVTNDDGTFAIAAQPFTYEAGRAQ